MILKPGEKEHFRYVSTMPGAQCAVTTTLTQVMLKYYVYTILVVKRQIQTIDRFNSSGNIMSPMIKISLLITGTTAMPATSISSVSAPLFLSSLHCSEGDESLLADCSHDLIGLAKCDETS